MVSWADKELSYVHLSASHTILIKSTKYISIKYIKSSNAEQSFQDYILH